MKLNDGKDILISRWKTTSLPGEFTLNLHSFPQAASSLRSIILLESGIISATVAPVRASSWPWPDPALTLSSARMDFPAWGELNKGLGFKGRAGCRARQRGGEQPSQYLCSPSISGFPSPLLPQPRQEANCKLLDEKETLGYQVPWPYFSFLFFCFLMG